MTFDKLGLTDSLLKAVKVSGYTKPTLIQEKAIPAILSGKDVMAAAQTGTGKTAGFTLPLLQLLNWKKKTTPYEIRALVLTPTRELAAQVKESIEKYGADGVRVGMLLCSPAGNDLPFDEALCEQGRNFANKIWNAFRLIKSWNVSDELDQLDSSKVAVEWFAAKLSDNLKGTANYKQDRAGRS